MKSKKQLNYLFRSSIRAMLAPIKRFRFSRIFLSQVKPFFEYLDIGIDLMKRSSCLNSLLLLAIFVFLCMFFIKTLFYFITQSFFNIIYIYLMSALYPCIIENDRTNSNAFAEKLQNIMVSNPVKT